MTAPAVDGRGRPGPQPAAVGVPPSIARGPSRGSLVCRPFVPTALVAILAPGLAGAPSAVGGGAARSTLAPCRRARAARPAASQSVCRPASGGRRDRALLLRHRPQARACGRRMEWAVSGTLNRPQPRPAPVPGEYCRAIEPICAARTGTPGAHRRNGLPGGGTGTPRHPVRVVSRRRSDARARSGPGHQRHARPVRASSAMPMCNDLHAWSAPSRGMRAPDPAQSPAQSRHKPGRARSEPCADWPGTAVVGPVGAASRPVGRGPCSVRPLAAVARRPLDPGDARLRRRCSSARFPR